MVTLDRVTELQQKGMPDAEITKVLRDEGVSPQEINDSLNQAKVKSAVSQDPPTQQDPPQTQTTQVPVTQEAPQMPDMQQSLQPPQQQTYEQPQQQTQQEQYYYPETPQAYSENSYYSQAPSVNTDTITEIAEQVVIEKLEEFKEKTGDIASFKNRISDNVEDIDERLKKIEASIDKLQQAVIGKIGEFGENSTYIRKDLNNLHNTVSKLMNPLIDNYKELKKISKGK